VKRTSFRLLPGGIDRWGGRIVGRLARPFAAFGVKPNAITWLALAASGAAGYFLWRGRPLAAGLLVVFGGGLDMLDGKVAQLTGRQTRFGALLDSTLDRYAEFALYLGLAAYFWGRWPLWLAFGAFLGSTMVSYTRARAEGLGFACREGIMQRAERLILLGLGCLAACLFPVFDQAMIAVLALITVFSNITAFQRLWGIRALDRQGPDMK
jgi:CDP-diacylglycerol--glycerol-3-phosphate 3-phosphatidyltransferase